MPPTPPSTTPSSSGHSPQQDAQFRVVRKRNRVPLSCGPCRHRKLKCNRGHPCDNCTKRGDAGSCTYATPGSRKKSSSSASSGASPDEMQTRIDRLEGLVLSLMTNGAQSAGPTAAQAAIADSCNGSAEHPYDLSQADSIKEEDEAEESEVEHVTKSIGIMKVDNNRAVYASEAHWYAILGELNEVKTYFSEHKKQYEDQLKKYKANTSDEYSPGTSFLFGGQKPTSKAEVLSRFPPKHTADVLIGRYFNTYDPAIHIIHGQTFQKQYNKHWLNPNETPVIWLGLSFAMMTIALQSYSRAGDEPPEFHGRSWAMSSDYRNLTAQCLVLADITQPIQDMLETLILHVYADYSRSRDSEVSVLLSTGLIVRLGMRMGLHRDSAPYPGISVFQGEMRRRVWACIRSFDLLFSAQAGMPPIVRPQDANTDLPRNIYDDELHEDMKMLPMSRPETEATPVLYLINRTRLVYLLGETLELISKPDCRSYDEIMRIDRQARELHEQISPHLKMRSMDESARDTSTLIMQRFTLDLLFLKTICILHRKFLQLARTHPRFTYSRNVCIDASMTMLQHQATLHRECQPGGRLRNVKWFISSLTTVDFLLAAMIVCSDLYHTIAAERRGRTPSTDAYFCAPDRWAEMTAAIETAVGIWEGLKDHSMEAFKAHTTLAVMLDSLKQHQAMRQAQGFSTSNYSPSSGLEDSNVAPEHSAAMTLGMLSTGGMATTSANMFDTRYPASIGNLLNDPVPSAQPSTGMPYGGLPANTLTGPENAPSPFSSLFGNNFGFQNMDLPSTTNIDWDAWDSYIQGPGSVDASSQFFPMDLSGSGSLVGLQTEGQNGAANLQNNLFASGGGGVFMGSQDAKRSPTGGGFTMGFSIPKTS